MAEKRPTSARDLAARKHITFGFKVGGVPPPRVYYANTPFGGIWDAIENDLVIHDFDTELPSGDRVEAGYSQWAEVILADRLEARAASNSVHGRLNKLMRQQEVDYVIEVAFSDFSMYVRKRRLNPLELRAKLQKLGVSTNGTE